jgi:hypothetical protein
MLYNKYLGYHNKIEYAPCTSNVRVDHNSNIDKRDELHNKLLKYRKTSSKYPNKFIHPNQFFPNNDYNISIYTYSHISHVSPLLD